MEEELLKYILVNMPNILGFGVMAILFYRQNNKLIDQRDDDLKFWRDLARDLGDIIKRTDLSA